MQASASVIKAETLATETSSEHRATSYSDARFLRNAIAKEATPSFEARERID